MTLQQAMLTIDYQHPAWLRTTGEVVARTISWAVGVALVFNIIIAII
jgi:hypothetical protein